MESRHSLHISHSNLWVKGPNHSDKTISKTQLTTSISNDNKISTKSDCSKAPSSRPTKLDPIESKTNNGTGNVSEIKYSITTISHETFKESQSKPTMDKNTSKKNNDKINFHKAESKQSFKEETKEEKNSNDNCNHIGYSDSHIQSKESNIQHPEAGTKITYADIVKGRWQPIDQSSNLYKSDNPPANVEWCKKYTRDLEKLGNY